MQSGDLSGALQFDLFIIFEAGSLVHGGRSSAGAHPAAPSPCPGWGWTQLSGWTELNWTCK